MEWRRLCISCEAVGAAGNLAPLGRRSPGDANERAVLPARTTVGDGPAKTRGIGQVPAQGPHADQPQSGQSHWRDTRVNSRANRLSTQPTTAGEQPLHSSVPSIQSPPHDLETDPSTSDASRDDESPQPGRAPARVDLSRYLTGGVDSPVVGGDGRGSSTYSMNSIGGSIIA